MIRVLILDDELLISEYVHSHLEGDSQIAIIKTAWDVCEMGDGETALSRINQLIGSENPDVVVLDLVWRADVRWGWDILRWLRKSHPRIQVIIFTNSQVLADVNEAEEEGASGYVWKLDWRELLPAIVAANGGQTYYSHNVPTPRSRQVKDLTRTENKVFWRVVRDIPRVKIATELGVTREAIDVHVGNSEGKIGHRDGWKGVAKRAERDPSWLCELGVMERRVFDLYVKGSTRADVISEILRVPKDGVKDLMHRVRRTINCHPDGWKGIARDLRQID